MAGNLPDIPNIPVIPSLPDPPAANECLPVPPGSEQFANDVYEEWGAGGVVFLAVPPLLCVIVLLLFVESVSFIVKMTDPHHLRRKMIWILAMQPTIIVLGTIVIFMPRATVYLTFLYQSNVAVGVYMFYLFLMELNGGASAFLKKTEGKEITSFHLPLCCCLCLPKMTNSRRARLLGKRLIIQTVFIAPACTFIACLLKEDLKLSPIEGREYFKFNPLNPLTLIKSVSTLVSLYGFLIIARFTVQIEGMEKKYKIRGKTVCIALTNLATGVIPNVFQIMTFFGVFSCVDPLRFNGSIGVILNYTIVCISFLTFLLTRRLYRRKEDFEQEDSMTNDAGVSIEEKYSDDSVKSKAAYSNNSFNENHTSKNDFASETVKMESSPL